MHITYDLSIEDLTAFRRHFQRRSSYTRAVYWVGYAAFPLTVVLLELLGDGFLYVWSTIYTALAVVAWLVGYPYLYNWLGNYELKKLHAGARNQGLFGKHTVELREDALIEETSVNKSQFSWAGIQTVEQTEHHIFIYVSSTAAHVIPKRSFQSAAAAEQFYLAARAFHENVRDRQS